MTAGMETASKKWGGGGGGGGQPNLKMQTAWP